MARVSFNGANVREVELPVLVLREGRRFVAYTPALDLSTSGKTMKEVQRRFGEVVHVFFRELIDRGTLGEVLDDLGWRKTKTAWQPPVVVSPSDLFSVTIPTGM